MRDIRRQTRRKYSAEEKIRIVLEGLRGEESIAELCRREVTQPRYRHAEGVRCSCKRRSVDAKQIEDDFPRLVQLLALKPEAHQLMLDLAMGANSDAADAEDLEREKRAAIAVLKQQLVNLLDPYKNAVISAEEYYRDKQDRERQIALWEARTTDMQKKSVELGRVMAAFSQVVHLWEATDSDGRTGLARGLFQYLVCDLDKRQIVDFRLHPWADQYLMLRADLYGDDDGTDTDSLDDEIEGNEYRSTTVSSDEAIVSPNAASLIVGIFAVGFSAISTATPLDFSSDEVLPPTGCQRRPGVKPGMICLPPGAIGEVSISG